MLLFMNCKFKLLPDSEKANISPAQVVDRVILPWLLDQHYFYYTTVELFKKWIFFKIKL